MHGQNHIKLKFEYQLSKLQIFKHAHFRHTYSTTWMDTFFQSCKPFEKSFTYNSWNLWDTKCYIVAMYWPHKNCVYYRILYYFYDYLPKHTYFPTILSTRINCNEQIFSFIYKSLPDMKISYKWLQLTAVNID